ncbi:MAG: FG-GAP-like repeat-containing protein [Bacteroidota bacterium]
MRLILLSISIIIPQLLSAQKFMEVAQSPPFDGVLRSAIAFADIDGDGDQDVLITGQKSSMELILISKLYTNDGSGKFVEKPGTSFQGVRNGSIAFADIDGDDDQDLIITGLNDSIVPVTKLFTNDGFGNFTEQAIPTIDGVSYSSIAFSDVDGDGDQDLFITGRNDSSRTSKLYLNDGMGCFAEKTRTPFDGIESGSIGFSDVDGDNDQDLLITGLSDSGRVSKLYINDGGGNFSEKLGTPFIGVLGSAIAFADVDGDNDQDILITGEEDILIFPSIATQTSKLYTNDGEGNFTEIVGTPFVGVSNGSIAFADVDGDADQDVFITGFSGNAPISKLYTNNGTSDFTELEDTAIDSVGYSSIAFTDVDGDNDQDVLVTGFKGLPSRSTITKLYINKQLLSSTEDLLNKHSLELRPYPNPTKGDRLTIKFNSSQNGIMQMKLYDQNGKILRRRKEVVSIGEEILSFDISFLTPGCYVILMESEEQKGAARFIIGSAW